MRGMVRAEVRAEAEKAKAQRKRRGQAGTPTNSRTRS